MREHAPILSQPQNNPPVINDALQHPGPGSEDTRHRIIQRLPLQRKLAVGPVNDPLEDEADAMAERVMRMPEPAFIQRKCGHCEEEEKLQRKPFASSVQRKESTATTAVSSDISNRINTSKGAGNCMDGDTKSFMESRFGKDFSSIKIHTGDEAEKISNTVNARAFTVGDNIFFNEKQYQPLARDGKHLLAHELTHTIQQDSGKEDKLQRTAQTFIQEVVAAQLREAMEGWGTDEDAIYAALAGRPQAEVNSISLAYQRLTRRSLQADLQDELTSSELLHLASVSTPFAMSEDAQAIAIAHQLNNAMAGWGTNEEAVYAALTGRTPQMKAAVSAAYFQITRRQLIDDLRDELTDSEYRRAMMLMNGNSLAQLLPYIGSGGISIGTDAIESSDEYRTLMDPASPWQVTHHVTPDEARLVSLLILNHLHNGGRFSWQADGISFLQSARNRLQHTAASQATPASRLGIEISVVSEPESIRLFNEMSSLTFFTTTGAEQPVPFHYPADGCYARAHMMAQRLTALGYASRKEFVISTAPQGLTVRSDYSQDTQVPGAPATTTWWYHVAPVMSVQQADGTVIQKIIDPSLDNHPITIGEWTAKMRGDAFANMSLEDVASYLGSHGNFGGIGNITYAADRDSFYAGDLRSAPDAMAANSQFQNVHLTMTGYANRVPAQELAFVLRQQMNNPAVNITAVMQKISTMPLAGRQYFLAKFPHLLNALFNSGRIQQADYLNMIVALNAL